MLAELAVILVILATVAFVYLKGTLIKSFVILINAFIASTVAVAFFETLAQFVISYGGEWTSGGVFLLVFALVFGILNVIGGKLVPSDLYFGDFVDRAVRTLIGGFAGFVIAGVILIAVAMMPLGRWPYERFNLQRDVNRPSSPDKTLILNADGFVVNFASWLSKGSMSGEKSLAASHPDFLNEIYLNRIGKK